jgi:hypothetical protein
MLTAFCMGMIPLSRLRNNSVRSNQRIGAA